MTNYEMLSVGVSVLAIIISFIAIAQAKNAFRLSEGATEISIHELISGAKRGVEDISMQLVPLKAKASTNAEEKRLLDGYMKVFNARLENAVNAYEEACAKYVDGKVDKARFRKLYHVELRNLVTDAEHRKFFDAVSSKYKAILKVYAEWENLER